MPFLRYVIARINLDNREMTYRFYITEGLKIISENTAAYAGGSVLSKSYFDVLKPQKKETRTAKEVIDHIKKGLSE